MNKKKFLKYLIVFILVITLTGCTQILKNEDGKPVKNPETGQTMTKNILCQPTEKKSIEIYKKKQSRYRKASRM